ncbi:MAG: hypothetical protein ACRD02_04755 [Acidimicrobiia bacterium]
MDLTRLRLLLSARWGVLVAMGLVGVASSVIFTKLQAQEAEPMFKATAPLFVETPEGGRGLEQVRVSVDAAIHTASGVNADFLAPGRAEIQGDYVLSEMLFVGWGPSQEEATKIAEGLRQNYLVVGAEQQAAQLREELESITRRSLQVDAQLQELDAASGLTPAEQSELAFLEAQIDALSQQAVALAVELTVTQASPPTEFEVSQGARTAEEIQLELTAVQADLAARQARVTELSGPSQLSDEQALRKTALELQREALKTEYGEKYITLGELQEEQLAEVEPVEVVDVTPAAPSLPVNSALGAVAGVLTGLAGLILSDRARRPVWSPGDVKAFPTLGEVPPR